MPSLTLILDELGPTPKACAIASDSVRFQQFLDAVKRGCLELPIKSETLEQEFGIRGEDVRALRAIAQCLHYPVGSINRGKDSGYFWARDADELAVTERHLESRHRKVGLVLSAIQLTRTRLRGNRPRQENLFT